MKLNRYPRPSPPIKTEGQMNVDLACSYRLTVTVDKISQRNARKYLKMIEEIRDLMTDGSVKLRLRKDRKLSLNG